MEGNIATLSCVVTGIPEPSVSWLEVKTSTRYFGNTLALINVTREQAGDYICEANNTCGNDSKSGILIVNCKYIYILGYLTMHLWLNWLSIGLLGGRLQVQLRLDYHSGS